MMAGDIIAAQHFIENLEKKVQAANHNATGVSQKIDSVSTKHKKTNQIQTYYRNEQAMGGATKHLQTEEDKSSSSVQSSKQS